MSVEEKAVVEERVSGFQRFLKGVEFVGNKLPDPFWLFVILGLTVIGLSAYLSNLGLSVTYLSGRPGEGMITTEVVNLMSFPIMRELLQGLVTTFVTFAPLGLVLTLMLGIGIVEQTGMISALMRKTVLGMPPYAVTVAIAIIGIHANLASDAGIIFAPVIGGAIFKAVGRNPWVGIIAGYASASGGFTANTLVAGTDVLLAGITQQVAEARGIPGPTHPLINWYFMAVAAIVLIVVTVFVTEKITAKTLGDTYTGKIDAEEMAKHALTPEENRGLAFALVGFIVWAGLFLYLTVPADSFFRADDGSLVPRSPLILSIVPVLFSFFFTMGVSYGVGARIITSTGDVPKLMAKGMQGCLGFLVVALPASLFIRLFSMSRLDTILSVSGAQWLQAINLTGLPLLLMFILLVTCINMFLMSGSAKWLILAPIFVPMFAEMGFPPALTQVVYRIGDTASNVICPVSFYLPVVIGLLNQYKPREDIKVGIGTVISLGLPFTAAYLLVLMIQISIWFLLGLPLGPGTPITM